MRFFNQAGRERNRRKVRFLARCQNRINQGTTSPLGWESSVPQRSLALQILSQLINQIPHQSRPVSIRERSLQKGSSKHLEEKGHHCSCSDSDNSLPSSFSPPVAVSTSLVLCPLLVPLLVAQRHRVKALFISDRAEGWHSSVLAKKI